MRTMKMQDALVIRTGTLDLDCLDSASVPQILLYECE